CYNSHNFDESRRFSFPVVGMADCPGGGRSFEIRGAGRLRVDGPRRANAGADPCRSYPRASAWGQTLNPTAATPPSLDSSSAICVLLILLIPLAAAGIALINTGLGRSRNAAHMMLTSLCAMGVAAMVYFA